MFTTELEMKEKSMWMHFTSQQEHEHVATEGGLHPRLGSMTILQMLLHRNLWIEFKSQVLRDIQQMWKTCVYKKSLKV